MAWGLRDGRIALSAFLLFVVSAGAAVPMAGAATDPFVVYEVYHAGGTYRPEVRVKISVRSDYPGIRVFAHLRRHGSRYRARYIGALHYNGSDGRWRSYGSPASVPACPGGQPVCEGEGRPYGSWTVQTFDPVRGDRILVAGLRSDLRVEALSPSWRVRATTIGFRAVTAAEADATGAYVARLHVEHFRSATAPGGRYGSAAFVDLPCGAGTADLTAGAGHEPEHIDCGNGPGGAFSETPHGRRWTVAGDVVGNYNLPYRLVVLDYPK